MDAVTNTTNSIAETASNFSTLHEIANMLSLPRALAAHTQVDAQFRKHPVELLRRNRHVSRVVYQKENVGDHGVSTKLAVWNTAA